MFACNLAKRFETPDFIWTGKPVMAFYMW